jgi:hypothetical protein
MFVEAIKKTSGITRPIHFIMKEYGSDLVIPGAATLFFVNELGVAITCKHVVEILAKADNVNNQYSQFKKEKEVIPKKGYKNSLIQLEKKYGYHSNITTQIKMVFVNCVDKFVSFDIIPHPSADLAIIRFNGYSSVSYNEYAIFQKDETQFQQGKSLCRIGYPFPEFNNFQYNSTKDEIEWLPEGRNVTPIFPIDGIITRFLQNSEGEKSGIEISTPGLKGQSGGPLFDTDGKVYGMQSSTHHLHLGFDIKEKEILEGSKKKKVSNHPFLHLGNCVHLNVIKSFLKEKDIKFYEE